MEGTPKIWLYKGLGPLGAAQPLAWPPIGPQGGRAKPLIGGERKGQLRGGFSEAQEMATTTIFGSPT